MRRGFLIRGLGAALALLALMPAPATAEREQVQSYIFGNSLIHHLTESDTTTVPYWLARMAAADGRHYATDGQWGFLRDFARLPPKPNWSFDDVARVPGGFGPGGYDTVMINTANFIQNRPPDAPYQGDNTQGASPLSAALSVLDWVAAQGSAQGRAPRIMVYEGWPDMSPFTRRFPPRSRVLARYHTHALGPHHDWHEAFVAALRDARPDLEISLIPVSQVLSGLMTGVLSDLPATTFYTDTAPHGTATLYYLAAMVAHAGLFEAPPPDGFDPGGSVHEQVRALRAPLAQEIAAALGIKQDATPAGPAPDGVPPGVGLADPGLAMGLNGLADWSTQHPFLDLMKTARPWLGHTAEEWGAVSNEALDAGGYLDANGWPLAIPPNLRALEALLLTAQPEDASHLSGRYVVRYKGTGVLRVLGRADNRRYDYPNREIRFDYTPGPGSVALSLMETDPADPLRDITVIREDRQALHDLGVVFNPRWTARVADVRLYRFMDWMFTNGSDKLAWADRARPADATYVWRGVPVEVMVQLANELGADPWFTMPHRADDDYVRRFATHVRDHLAPGLRAHVEYSNEVWNFIFPQADWAREQANARWGDAAGDDAWMQYAGLRAAQMARIWRTVFGADAATRLVAVLGTHTGWPGLEQAALTAPLALDDGSLDAPPVTLFDAYAVTGYFGHALGAEDRTESVLGWIEASRAVARAEADRRGLDGTARDTYLAAHGYDLAFDLAAATLRSGSFKALLNKTFPYHAAAAARHGLRLMMYEGGTHVTGQGAAVENAELTDFFNAFNYSPQMGALYDDLLAGWRRAGGGPFNAFVDVSAPSRWGSWGALRHLQDDNPRWQALMRANAHPPDWAQPRPAGTFLQGVLRQAGDGGARIEGTAKSDILLGGAGDDVLAGHGGDDRLHGGGGADIAILPGTRADYSLRRDGPRSLLQGPQGTVTLVRIDRVAFADAPETLLAVTDLE